jgi:hypothetical protein
MYICIYMYLYIYTYIYIYIHIKSFIYLYAYVYEYVYTCVHQMRVLLKRKNMIVFCMVFYNSIEQNTHGCLLLQRIIIHYIQYYHIFPFKQCCSDWSYYIFMCSNNGDSLTKRYRDP